MRAAAFYFLAIIGSTLALPSIDWSKITPNNIYVEPQGVVEGAVDLPGSRVIGGTEVSRNSIPYQAALIINGGSFCGGSVISSLYILSAAHCTISASFIQVLLGAHNVNEAETTQLVITSTSVINHPQYDSSVLLNDISLIQLPTAITFNSNIQPITLAPASSGTFAGSSALLTGWGRTSDASNSISPTLQQVNLNILTNVVCALSYGTLIQSSHICTSGAGNIGACNGDSGGPLVVSGTQVGIVSFGTQQCAAGNPTAYARVASYRAWINQNSGV